MEQTELTPIQEEVKKRNNKSNAVTIKIILIALLIIALIIPITMVQNMITERNRTANEASAEVQQKWSKPQNITGPMLVIPYKEYIEQNEKSRNTVFIYLTGRAAYFRKFRNRRPEKRIIRYCRLSFISQTYRLIRYCILTAKKDHRTRISLK